MPRLLSTSLIALALLLGAAGAAPAAHAQQTPPEGSICDYNYPGAGDGIIQGGKCVYTAGTGVATKASQDTVTTVKEAGPAIDGVFARVLTWIASLFAWLLGVAAIALNYAVYYTVVTMGSYVHDLSAVGVTWRILRDIGNILLIFGFLAIGITTILNVDWYGGAKKLLPKLLIAAVFLNFSLFITEAVIDVGNLFATQFYTQINGGTLPTATDIANISIASEGISNKLMNQMGLQRIYAEARDKNYALPDGSSLFIAFMSIIVFIIAAFVMFSLAFILIARFVILLFLIIVAPVGFAGWAFPKLQGMAQSWWDALFRQAITAPVLLLLLYIALAVISDAKFLSFSPRGGEWTGLTADQLGNTNIIGFASILLSFLVAMGLLLAVVILSKKIGAFGAGWATKTAGKLSFGATAWGMRNTAGRASSYAARKVKSSKFGATKTGRLFATTLDRGAKGSFDIRGIAAAGGLKGIGVDAGAAQKGGYAADLKTRTEARAKYASELKGRALTDEEKKKQAELQAEIKKQEDILKGKKEQQTQKGGAGHDPALDKEIATLISTLQKTNKELNDLESVTDKGRKFQYVRNLDSAFVNRDASKAAAKKIRDETKKSPKEKALDDFKKALVDEAKSQEPPPTPAAPAQK